MKKLLVALAIVLLGVGFTTDYSNSPYYKTAVNELLDTVVEYDVEQKEFNFYGLVEYEQTMTIRILLLRRLIIEQQIELLEELEQAIEEKEGQFSI